MVFGFHEFSGSERKGVRHEHSPAKRSKFTDFSGNGTRPIYKLARPSLKRRSMTRFWRIRRIGHICDQSLRPAVPRAPQIPCANLDICRVLFSGTKANFVTSWRHSAIFVANAKTLDSVLSRAFFLFNDNFSACRNMFIDPLGIGDAQADAAVRAWPFAKVLGFFGDVVTIFIDGDAVEQKVVAFEAGPIVSAHLIFGVVKRLAAIDDVERTSWRCVLHARRAIHGVDTFAVLGDMDALSLQVDVQDHRLFLGYGWVGVGLRRLLPVDGFRGVGLFFALRDGFFVRRRAGLGTLRLARVLFDGFGMVIQHESGTNNEDDRRNHENDIRTGMFMTSWHIFGLLHISPC